MRSGPRNNIPEARRLRRSKIASRAQNTDSRPSPPSFRPRGRGRVRPRTKSKVLVCRQCFSRLGEIYKDIQVRSTDSGPTHLFGSSDGGRGGNGRRSNSRKSVVYGSSHLCRARIRYHSRSSSWRSCHRLGLQVTSPRGFHTPRTCCRRPSERSSE